jgi:hypothetical protein
LQPNYSPTKNNLFIFPFSTQKAKPNNMTRSQKAFCVAITVLLMIHRPVLGQTSRLDDSSFLHSLSVAVRIHYGAFMDQQAKLQYVEDGRPFLGEIDLLSQTTGKRPWQQLSGYPQFGLAFLYGKSGANVYIGHLAALLPFVDFHLLHGRIATTNLRLAVGPAWVEKEFNPETDYQNLVIGSHLNACIELMLSTDIRLFPRTALDLGLSFVHVSNGGFKLPNLGLNIPSLTAGLRYDLFQEQRRRNRPLPPAKKKVHYSLYSFVAGKQSIALESAVYLVNIFNLEALKDLSATSRLGGGINMTLDRANAHEIYGSPTYAWNRGPSHWQAALYVAYEYVLGDLSFPLQVGYYLYNNYLVNSIYQAVGVKYKFAEHWSTGFALKAHLGNGDFLQWGLGYKF